MLHVTPTQMRPDEPPDQQFCQHLPKIELHAHLTGSITRPILQAIYDERAVCEKGFKETVPDPRVALADETAGQSIGTFFAHFNTYLYKIISTIPALITATRAVLNAFADDGVAYLELRTTPRSIDGHSAEETIRAILAVITEWDTTNRMPTSLILSIDRAKHSPEQAIEIVDLATRLKGEGKPVVGVDLCGDPSKPVNIASFSPAFRRAKEHGLGITIHFAEVPASSSCEELEEMLSWDPDRLGHVIHVPPALRQCIIERGIGVELCLTCNVLAGMLPGANPETTIADHHFADWWSARYPNMSLGTDDVGVFGSTSSQEYQLAATHFRLSGSDLIDLSRSAMKGAFCEQKIKGLVLRRLDEFDGHLYTMW